MVSQQWQIDARMKLHHAVNIAGGQSAFARRHGLPNTKFLNDVLWGRKNSTPNLAAIVGVVPPVVMVRPKIERAPAAGCVEWNEDRIACLRKLWNEGLSMVQIGKRMNLSKNSIVGKAHRLGLSRQSPIKTREPGYVPRRHRAKRAGKVTLPKMVAAPIVVEPAEPPVVFKPRVYRHTDCVWPTGEGRNIQFECYAPAMPGRPYCAAHCRRAYTSAGSVTAGDAQAAGL